MTTETPKKHNQLKGRENYLAWVTRMEGLLSIDEVFARNATTDKLEIIGSTPPIKAENEKKAKKYILQNCDDTVMHSINPLMLSLDIELLLWVWKPGSLSNPHPAPRHQISSI